MVLTNQAPARAGATRRLLVVLLAALVALGAWLVSGSSGAAVPDTPPAVPKAVCGPGSLPETSTQGRVPTSDYTSGRVKQGYLCNTQQTAHQGNSGGFKTLRYVDSKGNTCAFYDSSLTLPRDVLANTLSGDGLGVMV